MKKSLIVALLSFFPAATLAQSNVTLYGKIDTGYTVSNGGSYEGAKGIEGKPQQWGNGSFTSRWGIKGHEDLGHNMNVYFNFEAAIDPENGSAERFDRMSIVGLSGNFGSIQFGRQPTLPHKILGQFYARINANTTSALGNTGLAAPTQLFARPGVHAMPRFNSSALYSSPVFSGFQVYALTVLKNDEVVDKTVYSFAATYENERFSAGVTYESKLDAYTNASWGFGVKYRFDGFTISSGFFDNHQDITGKGVYLGLSVPLEAFIVGTQVAYNTDAKVLTTSGEKKLSPVALELFGNYYLSTRTHLYAQLGYMDNDAKTFMNARRNYSGGIGIVHNF